MSVPTGLYGVDIILRIQILCSFVPNIVFCCEILGDAISVFAGYDRQL